MARGKYSVRSYKDWPADYEFKFNCYGEIPEEWNRHLSQSGKEYNEKTMFGAYDEEGYDMYGYSAFDLYGNYVGYGRGVDRAGWTDDDYLFERDFERKEDNQHFNVFRDLQFRSMLKDLWQIDNKVVEDIVLAHYGANAIEYFRQIKSSQETKE